MAGIPILSWALGDIVSRSQSEPEPILLEVVGFLTPEQGLGSGAVRRGA